MSTATRPRRSANLTSTAACMPSSPRSGGYCSSCWPKPSRSETTPRSDIRGGLFSGAGVRQHPYPALPNLPLRRRTRRGRYPPKKSFRGYIASKRRYFYGLRVHLVVTGAGEPVEFALAAGSEADVTIFKELELDLPEGSIVCADKAYTDYDYEDLLLEEVGLCA
jgi:Transposase DDE domain